MNILITKVGDAQIIARFEAAPASYISVVTEQMKKIVDLLYGAVKGNLSGGVLNKKTGRLSDSVQKDVNSSPALVIGRVWTEGVEYASIQERGGITRPHEIVVKSARALRFLGNGLSFSADVHGVARDMVFVKKVNHPGSKMPERSYMRKALGDNVMEIRQLLQIDPRSA